MITAPSPAQVIESAAKQVRVWEEGRDGCGCGASDGWGWLVGGMAGE